MREAVRWLTVCLPFAFLTSSCVAESATNILRLEMDAVINGERRHSFEDWRLNVTDTLGSGLSLDVSGSAVHVPTSKHDGIYALFRTIDTNQVDTWDRLVLALDASILSNRLEARAESFVQRHASAVSINSGEKIDLCQPGNPAKSPLSTCPLIVYMGTSAPSTPRVLRVGRRYVENGTSFVVERVTASYRSLSDDTSRRGIEASASPPALGRDAFLPSYITPVAARRLSPLDFRR